MRIKKGKEDQKNDNRTQLLCSLLKNEYLKNVIRGFMRKMHMVNEDNNPHIPVKKFQILQANENQTPILHLTQSHLYLSLSFKYNQLYNVDWMALNGYIGLIKYKLERNDHLVFSPNSPKLICENIGCDNGSDDKFETFKYIYKKKRHLFYDGEMLAAALINGGSIKCLEYIMENHEHPLAAHIYLLEASILDGAFERGRVEMLNYLYSQEKAEDKHKIVSLRTKLKLPLSKILELYNWVKNDIDKSVGWRLNILKMLVKEYISKIVDFNINQKEENWDGIFQNLEIYEMVYDLVPPLEVLNGVQDEKLKLAIHILYKKLTNNHEAILYYIFVIKKCCHLEAMKLIMNYPVYKLLITQNLLSVDQLVVYRMIEPNISFTNFVYLKSLLSSLDTTQTIKVPYNKINYFNQDSLEMYLRECKPEDLKEIIQKILFKPKVIHRHHYNRIAKFMMENFKDQIQSTKMLDSVSQNHFLHIAIHSNLYPPLVELVSSKILINLRSDIKTYIFMNDPSGNFQNNSGIQLQPSNFNSSLIINQISQLAKVGHILEMEKLIKYTCPGESTFWTNNFNEIIRSVINGSQIQVLDYLSQICPMELEYVLQKNMKTYISDIGRNGALNLLKSNYFNVALYKNEYIHAVLEGAITSGHISIVKYIYDLNPDQFELEQDWFIDKCISSKSYGLIEFVHNIGKVDLKKQLKRGEVTELVSIYNYINAIIDN